MADSEPNAIQVVPDKDRTPSLLKSTTKRSGPFHLFARRPQRSTRTNTEAQLVKETENLSEPLASDSSAKYGYLEHIQLYKGLCTPTGKPHKKKVRRFYQNQLDFILSLEAILLPKTTEEENDATTRLKREVRTIKLLSMIILLNNIFLVIIKMVAAIISKSLSVISSVVDSAVDLLSSLILIWTARQINKRDAYQYPTGRTRLEPIAVVILAVIMCSASIQVITESGQTLSDDIEYLSRPFNASSCKKLPDIRMSAFPIGVMGLTIVSKTILFILCHRIKNPTMDAFATDNRNDVASNIVALICGIIGSNALRNKIPQTAIIADPIGAILISVYIITSWIQQASTNVRHLTGLTAEPAFLQRITHLVYNFRPDIVTKIDTIRAVHCGTKYLVEVDIGLPGTMPLAMAHNIGEELQNQLEKLDDVERAFVHLDFEFTHMPSAEHKTV